MKNIFSLRFYKILFSLCIITFVFVPAFAQTSGTVYHPNPVIGLVDGVPVTFEDVRNKKANDLSLQLYQQLSVSLMEYALKVELWINSGLRLRSFWNNKFAVSICWTSTHWLLKRAGSFLIWKHPQIFCCKEILKPPI